jgi:hypothetical protein
MNPVRHTLALIGAGFSWFAALTPSDLAHLAAAFSGVCAGIYYAVQAAALIRAKFVRRRPRLS